MDAYRSALGLIQIILFPLTFSSISPSDASFGLSIPVFYLPFYRVFQHDAH